MIFLLIVTILAGVATAIPVNNTGSAQVEATFNSTLKCFQNYLSSQGNSSVGPNIQDPLVIPEIDINFDILDSSISLGYLVLNNVTVSGIKNVQKDSTIEYDEESGSIGVDIELTWPALSITGLYKANVTTRNLKIEGNGKFEVNITNIFVQGVVHYISPGTVVTIQFKPFVDQVQFQIDGLLINGKDRSEWVSEVVSNTSNEDSEQSREINAIIGAISTIIKNTSDSAQYVESTLGLAGISNTLIECSKG